MPEDFPQWTMRDPREHQPTPPFPDQPQSEPGLAREMEPKPDPGEQRYRGLGRLEGRTALVTGGDRGIGRAAALAFAREGAAVVINHLEEEEPDARELTDLIEREGGTIHAIPGDIREEAFCQRLVEEASEKLGGLDILVNNAGKQVSQESILDITTEQFDATFRTNVYAMFWISKAAIPHMPPGATIINVSSVQGYKPSDNLLDYAATKFAILGFTKSLAKQMMDRGIRVNAIAPGPFWTPLQPSEGQPAEKVQHFGEGKPYGRPGQPAEIAPAFVFLASGESTFMTGETVSLTGGNPTP